MLARRYPYTVVDVSLAADRTWLVSIEPSRVGIEFEAGQFVFLTLDDNPMSLEQHPFSIASSAGVPGRLEFAIKELGDYTSRIGTTPVGQTAYVDGPYGSLRLPTAPVAGMVMIAGGIGISPVMSMLRTMRDRGDVTPVVLIYAANRHEDLLFSDELDDLARLDHVEVVRVLLEPPVGWTEEQGLVGADVIERHLPTDAGAGWHAVICGPPVMMDVAERALRERGLPLSRIHSERFDIGAAGAVGERSVQVRRLVIALGAVMVSAAVIFAW